MSILTRLRSIDSGDLTLSRVLISIKKRLRNIPVLLIWRLNLSKRVRVNKKRIQKFHNIHKGKRCFVIANGPSLKNIDFNLLKNEYTIGMNRIYLMEKEMGFKPTYLAVADIAIQLAQFTDEYQNYKGPKFYGWGGRALFPNDIMDIHYFCQHPKYDFSPDFMKTISNSRSVTNTCLLLAFYMGFSEVILIGKDHSYDIKGKAGEDVVSTGEENNHFIKGYYNKGQIWKIPAYKDEELAYSLVRKGYEKAGRKIFDATVDGKLDVFEKIDFYSLFGKNNG